MKRHRFRADRTLPPPITGINAAGLLTILAVLIVMFMLRTPNHERGPHLPDATNAPFQRNPPWRARFTITLTGMVSVDHLPVREEELDEYIRRACQPSMRFLGMEDALYIEADPELSYATVLDILARCRAYGGDRAVFLTKRNVSILEAWASGSMPSPAEWRRALEEQTPTVWH